MRYPKNPARSATKISAGEISFLKTCGRLKEGGSSFIIWDVCNDYSTKNPAKKARRNQEPKTRKYIPALIQHVSKRRAWPSFCLPRRMAPVVLNVWSIH